MRSHGYQHSADNITNVLCVIGRVGLVRVIGNELNNPTSSTVLAKGTVANLDVEGNNVQVPRSSFVSATSPDITGTKHNVVAVGNQGAGAFENLAKAVAIWQGGLLLRQAATFLVYGAELGTSTLRLHPR